MQELHMFKTTGNARLVAQNIQPTQPADLHSVSPFPMGLPQYDRPTIACVGQLCVALCCHPAWPFARGFGHIAGSVGCLLLEYDRLRMSL